MTTVAADLQLSTDPSLLERIRVAYQALRILEKEPDDPIAGPLFNAALERGAYRMLLDRWSDEAAFSRMLRERPSMNAHEIDLETFLTYPEDTLGQRIARYYRDNDIAPFHTTFEVRDDIDYISKRYRETHDVFHLVTDYGTDVVGEMELQAFAMGNLGIKGPWMILLFSTVLLWRGDSHATGVDIVWRDYFRRLRAAFKRGKATPPMLAYPFQERWDAAVDDVRRDLQL